MEQDESMLLNAIAEDIEDYFMVTKFNERNIK